MKKLYICEYPYVLYKTLIERMGDDENSYSLILSDARADMEPMVPILRQSGLFEQVDFFPSEAYRDYYNILTSASGWHYIRGLVSQLRMALWQKKFKNIKFPFEIDFKQHDKIICIDHPYVINGYLNMNHIEYSISEHARSVFKRNAYPKLAALYLYVFGILDKLHIFPGIRSASRFCKEVIVDDATDLSYCLRGKTVTEWNVYKHVKALDAKRKEQIFQLYAEAYNLNIDMNQTYDLLMTSSFFKDGWLPSEENQVKMYKDLIRKYLNYPVLIKPHPRDNVDYRKFFPECIVINPNISSEVLSHGQNLKLKTVLTLVSSSASSFQEKAEKLIVLEEGIPVPYMKTLKPYL